MLTRTLRRAALDTRWTLPPPYLLPWTATLTIQSHPPPSAGLPPSTLSPSEPITTISEPTPATSTSPKTTSSPPLSKRKVLPPPTLSPSVKFLLPLLLAQRQIYIKAHIHARPYLLTQGDTLRLPFLMNGVQAGDVLRLDRATAIGSRDFTLKAPAAPRRGKSATAGTGRLTEIGPGAARAAGGEEASVVGPGASGPVEVEGPPVADEVAAATDEPFVPHLAQGRIKYLDDRLFVCRATVLGTESEPLRIMEKTKRRQRHTRHVKSKHRYTVLRIKEVRVRSVEEVESGRLE